jgi:hypothetical protein
MADITLTQVNTAVGLRGPLSKLDESSNDLSVVKYPSDLGEKTDTSKNAKNHWVTFRIYDIEPAAIKSASTGFANNQTVLGISDKAATAVGILGGVAVGAGAVLGSESAAGNKALSVGAFSVLGAVGLGLGFTVSPQISKIKSCISLYMPDTLTAAYDANYEEMSLTQDLGPAITTLRAVGNIADGVLSGLGKGNSLGGDPNVVQAAVAAASAIGVPGVNVENLGTLLQRAQGYAINPQLQMVYRGTGLRSFQLSFTFTPKSKDEGIQVNNIINQFRFYFSPSLGQNAGKNTQATTNSMFLIPPSIFEIDFYVNGQRSLNLPRYGRCVMTALDVNHAPNGFATYEDSTMLQTTLQMSFKEMDILTRDNFKDTTNPRR